MYSIIECHLPDVRNELCEKELLENNSNVVFWMGNCVLVETLTSSCRYLYRVVNIESGQSNKCCERKEKLHRTQFDRVAERITTMPLYSPRKLPSEKERGFRLIKRIFKEILPQHGFIYRPKQEELSQSIFSAMQSGQIALCEAGTGSGKTLAYLVATVVVGLFRCDLSTAIISTSTIALQKAITEEYLPRLSEILLAHRVIERPISFVVRKGKSHYACDLRLQDYHSSITNLNEDIQLLEQLNALKKANYDSIDLSQYPFTRYVNDRICAQGKCAQNCPLMISCRYQRHISECLNSHYTVQVSNHNYIFAHIQHLKAGGSGLLPKYHMIVFDEAHKLLDAARQIYGLEYARSELELFAKDIPLGRFTSTQHRALVGGWIEMLLERNKRLFELLAQRKPNTLANNETRIAADIGTASISCISKLVADLEHLSTLLGCHCDKQMRGQLPVLRARSKKISDKLTRFQQPSGLISWLEYHGGDINLCSIPQNLNQLLYSDLWSAESPCVLTSGTLSAGGDYDLLKRTLGLSMLPASKTEETSMISPFDYKENTLLYIPGYMPFPDIRDLAYVNTVAKNVLQLVDATAGHTLVLFTSHWLTERIYGMTKDEIAQKYPAFILKRGRVDVLSEFKDSQNGVLFASDAAGEGVDLPGDILSSLIIVKLPFDVPDPISEFEKKQYGSLRAYQEKVILPRMLVKLRQYAGRAIRTETDTAVISILDSRVGHKGKYRQVVLNALFDTAVTEDIHDVRVFIRRKKDSAYFI